MRAAADAQVQIVRLCLFFLPFGASRFPSPVRPSLHLQLFRDLLLYACFALELISFQKTPYPHFHLLYVVKGVFTFVLSGLSPALHLPHAIHNMFVFSSNSAAVLPRKIEPSSCPNDSTSPQIQSGDGERSGEPSLPMLSNICQHLPG